MMAVHLAREHSARSRPVRMPITKAMSGWRMRRLIDFIEAHLDGDLSLEAHSVLGHGGLSLRGMPFRRIQPTLRVSSGNG